MNATATATAPSAAKLEAASTKAAKAQGSPQQLTITPIKKDTLPAKGQSSFSHSGRHSHKDVTLADHASKRHPTNAALMCHSSTATQTLAETSVQSIG
jgi:hypothetical protein